MNSGTAKDIKKTMGYDPKERTYTQNKKTGVICSDDKRQAYQKAKRNHDRG